MLAIIETGIYYNRNIYKNYSKTKDNKNINYKPNTWNNYC